MITTVSRLQDLEQLAASGDRPRVLVEVFTSKAQNAGPSRDWLNFVTSPPSRGKKTSEAESQTRIENRRSP